MKYSDLTIAKDTKGNKIGEAFVFALKTAMDYVSFTSVVKSDEFKELISSLKLVGIVEVFISSGDDNGTIYYKLAVYSNNLTKDSDSINKLLEYIDDKTKE